MSIDNLTADILTDQQVEAFQKITKIASHVDFNDEIVRRTFKFFKVIFVDLFFFISYLIGVE